MIKIIIVQMTDFPTHRHCHVWCMVNYCVGMFCAVGDLMYACLSKQ